MKKLIALPRSIKGKLYLAAAGIILFSNLSIFARAAYNHQSVHYSITLSERELRLPYRYGDNNDNSGVSLRINWASKSVNDYQRGLHLTSKHHQSFGFSAQCHTQRAKRAKPKQGWVLLELNGPHYRDALLKLKNELNNKKNELIKKKETPEEIEEYLKTLEDRYTQESTKETRLIAIDAAANKQSLTNIIKNKDKNTQAQYLVVKAEINEHYDTCSKGNQYRINISTLHLAPLNLPRKYSQQLPYFIRDYSRDEHAVKYSAKVNIGKLGDPWIEAFTLNTSSL